MGALVAVIDKREENAVEKALTMLKTLRHRFDHSYGVATENAVFIAKADKRIQNDITKASATIGYGLCKTKLEDQPQPVLRENFALAFEGRFFPLKEPSDLEFAVRFLEEKPKKKSKEIIEKIDGSYNFVILHKNRIFAGRDPFGTRPLYYGENKEVLALASEMKALWKLGIENVQSVPPGTLAVISRQGCVFEKIKDFPEPVEAKINEDEAVRRLQSLLLESLHERIEDLSKVAVAFSGGVDSGTVAFLTRKCNVEPQLICVGLEGKKELQEALSLADELDSPIHVRVLSEEEVERIIPKVLWLIEEPNPVKLSIAIPFFFTAETAKTLGFNVILAGQGSDELFGGYKRYLQFYAEKGGKA